MNVRIKLGSRVSAFHVDEEGRTGHCNTEGVINIELPDGGPVSAAFVELLSSVVGSEFTDMAVDSVYKIAALAALKKQIQ
jgi:hypothetical protein